MNKIIRVSIIPVACLALSASFLLSTFSKKKEIIVEAASLPTDIDLKDCTEQEILEYYKDLNSLTPDQKRGTNLLKNLKSIIHENVTYYSYGDASNIYLITDRDWVNSRKEDISGYNSGNDTISGFSYSSDKNSNPYLHLLYCDYTVQSKTHYSGDGDVNSSSVSFDKEHVWSQSHGFDDGVNSNLTGAGSDLHHLKAGTQYGNRTMHSNYSYGYVKTNKGDQSKAYERKNKFGDPLFSHSGDQKSNVFEPQDSDKGDIARALLYMAACYNNLDGSVPQPADPALTLVNYIVSNTNTGYSSVNITNGYYGTLQDILAWHYDDPVDAYEIHRNNLIYKNYQGNRNPFIDYPEWVEYIWGTSRFDKLSKTISYNSTSTGYADLNNDVINDYIRNTKAVLSISVTTQPSKNTYYQDESFDSTGMVVTATYEDYTTADITPLCTISVDTSMYGNISGSVSYKNKSATFPITVLENTAEPETISLNKTSASIEVGKTTSIVATVDPINTRNKGVIWSSDNTSIATVDSNGTITGVAEGSTTITAKSVVDNTISATCSVNVFLKRYITDTLDKAATGDPSSYTDWADVTLSSSASYSGRSNGGNNSVQLTNSTVGGTPGIYNTASGGLISEIEIDWNNNTSSSGTKTLSFYGFNEPFASIDDISNGTLIGSSTYDSNDLIKTVTIDGDYEYFGVLASSALYVNSFKFKWSVESAIEVTGVELSSPSLTIEKGQSSQLVVTILPAEAENKNFTLTSSVPSVATVDSTGLVSAISVGKTTITVTTEDGGFTDTCEVTVTPKSVGTSYYRKISYTNNLPTGQYIITANVGGTYYAMPNTYASQIDSVPVTVTDNVISLADGSSKVLTMTNNSTYYSIYNGTAYLGAGASSGQFRTSSTSDSDLKERWTIEAGIKGTFRIKNINYDSKGVIYRSSSAKFGAFANSNVTAGGTDYYDLEIFEYVDAGGSYTIDNFVAEFLNAFTCTADGTKAPKFNTGWSWDVLADKFDDLTGEEKLELKTYSADQYGNDEARCVARYDYIVGKYGEDSYANFMERNVPQHTGKVVTVLNSENTGNYLTIIIVVLSLTGLVGCFFYLKKRYK